MAGLKRCSNCVIPETHETVVFDKTGVCNVCRQHEFKNKNINWVEKKKELDNLIAKYRGRFEYDCLIPFSGGKDSTWTLYYLVKEYNLKPLVVRFDHGFLRPNVLENTIRTSRKLGVDFHNFTPSWKVVQKLMLQGFLEKGDFCWHCHTGVFAYPMSVAIRMNIPLIFWGEPAAEYTAYYNYNQTEEVNERRFSYCYANLGITVEDMSNNLEGVYARDLKPFTYPIIDDLQRIGCRSVCLGSYIPWDTKRQSRIISKELGWNGDEVEGVPPGYEYEKIECYLQGVRDYIKYIKRGYTRPTHLASLDIRNGRMTREQGLELIDKHEGKRPASLDLFLEYIGLTEGEFLEIVMSHSVSPYVHDPTITTSGKMLHDFSYWTRHGAMLRVESERQIENWRKNRNE